MTTLTTTSHTDAALARIGAVFALMATPRAAYRLDGVPAVSPKQYVEIECERRYLEDPRMAPYSTMRLWRVTCYWVADTVRNADLLEAACTDAFEQITLTVGGQTTTPLQHELTEPTKQTPDSTWSGWVEFSYAI